MTDPHAPTKLAQNPLEGDENFEICVIRQVNRKVPESVAKEICVNLSAALGSNALKEASDMILVPAVLTAEGVHNGLFKPWDSIANAAATLVGVPFFVNQPGEHENGVTPPVDDPLTHHGLVVQVNKDEARRRLTGIIGLFKPEYLKANGFSPARVKFQETLVNSIKKGARFAISVSYLARLLKKMGMHANRAFAYVETKHVFNGVSIVPEGAEPTALMNGATGDSSVDVIEGGFNADLDAKELSNSPDAIESLNMAHEQSGTKAMDADQLRSMSITRLGEMNPEVASLANEHKRVLGELQTANKKSADLEGQVKSLSKDAEKTSEVLANILDAEEPEKILAGVEGTLPLAEQVQEVSEKLANELSERRKADEKVLDARIEKATKSLANRMKADDLKPFIDPADKASTAARLEKLSNSLSARRLVPHEEVIAGANADLEDFESEEDEDSGDESIANGEYEALSNVFEPAVAAPSGAGKKRPGGDA